jgi:hypothetical protein
MRGTDWSVRVKQEIQGETCNAYFQSNILVDMVKLARSKLVIRSKFSID